MALNAGGQRSCVVVAVVISLYLVPEIMYLSLLGLSTERLPCLGVPAPLVFVLGYEGCGETITELSSRTL